MEKNKTQETEVKPTENVDAPDRYDKKEIQRAYYRVDSSFGELVKIIRTTNCLLPYDASLNLDRAIKDLANLRVILESIK